MKNKRFNIALIPNKELFEYAIKISNNLSKLGKYLFILDGKNYFPHITVYSPEFPKRNLNKIIKNVEKVSKNFKPFQIKFTECKFVDDYAGIDVQSSKQIYSLHEKIIDCLNSLREGVLRDKYKNKDVLINFTKKQINNIEKYGYPDVKELYIPHLSLIRFGKNIPSVLEKKFRWDIQSSVVDKIGIFEMGDYGTCIRLVKEFELGNR
jgi:2'-5' RNA ligase